MMSTILFTFGGLALAVIGFLAGIRRGRASDSPQKLPAPPTSSPDEAEPVTQKSESKTPQNEPDLELQNRLRLQDELLAARQEVDRVVSARAEFLASVSHELRTPLNVILGMSEALLEDVYGDLHSGQHEAVEEIQSSGQYLLEVINDLLDITRLDSNQMHLRLERIKPELLMRDVVQNVAHQSKVKRITVNTSIDSTVDFVQADARRMRQILTNLLNNAVKFTPDGGEVGITIKRDEENEENKAVRFSVWDTGIGIRKEDFPKLFQPFTQLDSSTTRRYGGTGLGLSLCKRLTELHQGTISVKSELGKGSQFTVRLPWLDIQPPDTRLLGAGTPPSLSPQPRRWRACIIEESQLASEQLCRYLRELHIETCSELDPDDVVESVADQAPDIVFLGLFLPDESGWEILEALRQDARTSEIPVVVVSVLDEPDTAATLGAAATLIKPIHRRELHQALNQALPEFVLSRVPEKEGLPEPAGEREPIGTVMIVEDNLSNLNTYRTYLQSRHYRVLDAANGKKAIELLESGEHPDIILMDIQMPVMDGLEATRHIRGMEEFQDVPIIALTALVMPGDRDNCLQAGATAYMGKPVRLRDLDQMVKDWMP